MREGVVVMLDALGFRGIWKASTPAAEAALADVVLAKMKWLRDQTEKFRTSPGAAGPISMQCDCISDTIVLGVWPEDTAVKQIPLITAITCASAICEGALGPLPPALAYRGAVSFGRFQMEKGFIIGPAVDEAATNMELAEGAFVWLTPSALTQVDGAMVAGMIAHKYPVSLKGGATFDTFALLPWSAASNDVARFADIAQRLLDTFDRSKDLSVAIKRQNTAKFFNSALADAHARAVRLARVRPQEKPLPPEPPVVK